MVAASTMPGIVVPWPAASWPAGSLFWPSGHWTSHALNAWISPNCVLVMRLARSTSCWLLVFVCASCAIWTPWPWWVTIVRANVTSSALWSTCWDC